MIDFVRVVYNEKESMEEYLLDKENFETVYTLFELHSGEILYPYKTNLGNMDIVITDKTIYLKNSIHKLFNTLHGYGNQNHSDFTYSQLSEMVDYLDDKVIGCAMERLTKLEFGLNIDIPKPAEDLINQNFFMHNLKGFTRNLKFNGRGEYLQYDHADYAIKAYDKAKQYGLSSNKFRFEVKFTRKRPFNTLGIYTLNDLLSQDHLNRLFEYLIKRFDEMIIVDNFIHIQDEHDKSLLIKYLNPRFWNNLNSFSRQTKYQQRQVFHKLLLKHDLLKTKRILRDALIAKFEFLMVN